MALSSDVEYLNSRDATIMGSRNGHAPIYLWYTLTRKGYEGMRRDVERCMRNAHVLKTVRRGILGKSCRVAGPQAVRGLMLSGWCLRNSGGPAGGVQSLIRLGRCLSLWRSPADAGERWHQDDAQRAVQHGGV